MGKESKIEGKACDYAKALGFYVRKFSSPGQNGVPDRLFLSPQGVVFFIEFKAPGKQPDAMQQREIQLIQRNKGNAYWVDSLEGAKKIIDLYTI